jgi:hypothetical protein
MDDDRFGSLLPEPGRGGPQNRYPDGGGYAAAGGSGYPGGAGYPDDGRYPNDGGGYPAPAAGYPNDGGYPGPGAGYPGAGSGYPPPSGYPEPSGYPDPSGYPAAPGGGGSRGAGTPGGPRRSGGPSGKVVAATLGVTALVAALAGGVYGLLRPSTDTVTPTQTSTAAPATTKATKPASSTKPAASTSAAATSSAAPTPRATAYVTDPTTVTGMDFGVLKGIARASGGVVLRVDRASFLTGKKAAAYYAAHPKLEPLDYAVINTNPRVRSFRLADGAVIYAQYALGTGTEVKTETISVDQLYTRATELLSSNQNTLLWLRHTEDPDGPVYYVAEQYVP